MPLHRFGRKRWDGCQSSAGNGFLREAVHDPDTHCRGMGVAIGYGRIVRKEKPLAPESAIPVREGGSWVGLPADGVDRA